VADRLNGFFINLLQGVLLVGLLMFAAIGVRAAVIVMLAVPIAIAIAIGLVDLSGFGLQQMTIAGLVIALGLLVDNAIVVIENTVRHRRQDSILSSRHPGYDPDRLGGNQLDGHHRAGLYPLDADRRHDRRLYPQHACDCGVYPDRVVVDFPDPNAVSRRSPAE
jgi:hypothetical protein